MGPMGISSIAASVGEESPSADANASAASANAIPPADDDDVKNVSRGGGGVGGRKIKGLPVVEGGEGTSGSYSCVDGDRRGEKEAEEGSFCSAAGSCAPDDVRLLGGGRTNGVLPLKHFERVVASLLASSSSPSEENRCCDGSSSGSTAAFITTSSSSPSSIQPAYVPLPTPPPEAAGLLDDGGGEGGGVVLPDAARVHETMDGQISNRGRAARKEEQLRCITRCVCALLPRGVLTRAAAAAAEATAGARRAAGDADAALATTAPAAGATAAAVVERSTTSGLAAGATSNCMLQQQQYQRAPGDYTVVDFGGGSGHLAIPLALKLPNVRVIVVELSGKSIDLLREKARACGTGGGGGDDGGYNTASDGMTPSTPPPSLPIERREHHHNNNGEDGGDSDGDDTNASTDSSSSNRPRRRLRQAPGIGNLYTFHGPLEEYAKLCRYDTDTSNDGSSCYRFDMGIALHLCGEATDVALRLCGSQRATCVFCPCCVGKLNDTRRNPYVWQATGDNAPTVRYPQSRAFRRIVTSRGDWNALAKAADYSDVGQFRTARNATRRAAKALVEADRIQFLREEFQYSHVVMTRMVPWEASPKNDIILAWNEAVNQSNDLVVGSTVSLAPDEACMADIQLTREHLFGPLLSSSQQEVKVEAQAQQQRSASVYWDHEEELEIRKTLREFFFSSDLPTTTTEPCHVGHDRQTQEHQRAATAAPKVYVFPTGMGGRKRKIVHYVAEQLKLAHWGQGRKEWEKTVAVAFRGTRRQRDEQSKLNTNHAVSSP